jgi:hypothetical protein
VKRVTGGENGSAVVANVAIRRVGHLFWIPCTRQLRPEELTGVKEVAAPAELPRKAKIGRYTGPDRRRLLDCGGSSTALGVEDSAPTKLGRIPAVQSLRRVDSRTVVQCFRENLPLVWQSSSLHSV